MVFKALGQHGRAREEFNATLAMDKEMYGPIHPEVASDLANSGQLALDNNEFDEAQRCFQEALEIDKASFGQKHPDVAIDLTNLGTLFSIQGKLSEAEPFFIQALQIRRETLGDSDVLTAQSMNILAYCLKQLNKDLEKANNLGLKALETCEDKLGTDHSYTVQLDLLWGGGGD